MTKKHFQRLAYELMLSRPSGQRTENDERFIQWDRDVTAVGKVCAQSNGAFDRNRFYAACEASSYSPGMHGR